MSEILIVSHGSPSDPAPQEAFVQGLAKSVAGVTGARVAGATLAMEGALEAVVMSLSRPLVFPHFMADGWFVSTNLPKRLRAAGLDSWLTATSLGMLDGLPQIAQARLDAVMMREGLSAERTTLIVAAHGSPSDPRPACATEQFAQSLRSQSQFHAVRVGYVDEEPSLADAATVNGPAIVLPFFAAEAGHVLMDLPDALGAVAFKGTVLPPIGTWPDIPALIGEAVSQPAKVNVA